MNYSAQEAVQNLVDALAAARAVYGTQRQSAEDARQNAEGTEEPFLSFLKAQQFDATSAEAQERQRQLLEQMRSRRSSQFGIEHLADMSARNLRWETALCDSQIALMRLYAYPEAQAGAERIAELLRTLRLLQVEHVPRTPPPAPSLPAINTETASEEERQQQKFGMALDFMQGMSGYREQVRQSYQERSNRTETLLRQAHEEAEALAQVIRN